MTPTFLGKRWLHRISLAAVAILLSIRMGLASDTEQERINTLLYMEMLDLPPPRRLQEGLHPPAPARRPRCTTAAAAAGR